MLGGVCLGMYVLGDVCLGMCVRASMCKGGYDFVRGIRTGMMG